MQILVGFPNSVALGEYILATNPYHAVFPPKGTWDKPYPPPVITFDKKCAGDPLLYALDSTGIEQHHKPGNWKFKYAEHYVDRAIRIPYMYYVSRSARKTMTTARSRTETS